MTRFGHDTLKTKKTLTVEGRTYHYFSLPEAEKSLGSLAALPYSLKILLENLLRFENGSTVKVPDFQKIATRGKGIRTHQEITYQPARVLMQDFTGVPAIVDLAAMREALQKKGCNPNQVNPLTPVDLVIDHSVMVDAYGDPEAFRINVEKEYHRNRERYAFLHWGQRSMTNFRVVPPGTGICHQVNLEYLSQVVWTKEEEGLLYAYPDTLVGTDSHTTMVNGLGILGWGVGGIEAEAAMLGQPISMVVPEVVGFKLLGALPEGSTATDLVLTVTQMLRARGVVNKFVEFYGEGLDHLSIADRATLGNMSPEFGATCGLFPIDAKTLEYLRFTGRDPHRVKLVEAYAKEQGLWRTPHQNFAFSETLELDLNTVEATLAGPKRPQDKILLADVSLSCQTSLQTPLQSPLLPTFKDDDQQETPLPKRFASEKGVQVHTKTRSFQVHPGDLVIAALTSCTNTSNPAVMVGAGLVARKALAKNLSVKPWVKTSLAPGSQVVTDYLTKAGLQKDLDQLGFHLVGYGCTTCIGNSGPLHPEIAEFIDQYNIPVASILSGNRNFEGRIHPKVKLNYLASPPLVVAYALAGTMLLNLKTDPLGYDPDGNPVYLKDIWPSHQEIQKTIETHLSPDMFRHRYADVFRGGEEWRHLSAGDSITYAWDPHSTYVRLPPFFKNASPETFSMPQKTQTLQGARILALLGDSITTDHISPAGSIKQDSPAGEYLKRHGVSVEDFNSYGARRGNHEVMMRGTFANIRLQNEMVPALQGGFTRVMPAGDLMTIYEAAMMYQSTGTPLVVIAGKEYGTGSSRDWAAKGPRLLGVKAVVAESLERIHRTNLVGMGVLPLEFKAGTTRKTLQLDGSELIDILGLDQDIRPGMDLTCRITTSRGFTKTLSLSCRIDTEDEVRYFRMGGILHYVLQQLENASPKDIKDRRL